MIKPRLRFAPSPTGNVHIGNIRVAVFNWLYARHCGGEFLLRIEDTDRQRSTPAAIANLLQVMDWLGLDYDEEPIYQSRQRQAHVRAAEKLLGEGHAYRQPGQEGGEAIVFRIPLDSNEIPGIKPVEEVKLELFSDQPVTVNAGGIGYALPSRKGKPVPQQSCLAGMRDLRVADAAGNTIFSIEEHLEEIVKNGREFSLTGAVTISFTRFQIAYQDLVKGCLSKPLDSLRDIVIVRSDGSPVFHLANVYDDLSQGITHIIRGDDHVENTYRHLFLFHALGGDIPQYAHLPMIVNAQGKPYSKRDGDAFVGEFREKGYLPEALFNYLTLLGWSSGDGREKMSRQELISSFSLERVQQTPAQMDIRKLENMNGQYIAELPPEDFIFRAREQVANYDWGRQVDPQLFARVAALMQSRTKTMIDVSDWDTFFVAIPSYDEKATAKQLVKPGVRDALADLAGRLPMIDWTLPVIEETIHEVTEKHGIAQGKLNQPLRLALTGRGVGAGLYETMELLGQQRVYERLTYALENFS